MNRPIKYKVVCTMTVDARPFKVGETIVPYILKWGDNFIAHLEENKKITRIGVAY